MSKETGGPAFPLSTVDPYEKSVTTCDGMALRDYFAAKAMQAWMTGWATDPEPYLRGKLSFDVMAEVSYFAADAMLKERDK